MVFKLRGDKMKVNSIEEVVEALKKGEIIIVTDEPDRENEGDMIQAAEFATGESLNTMASLAKGLICMPMSRAVSYTHLTLPTNREV